MNIENVKTPVKVGALLLALGMVAAAIFGCSIEAPFAPSNKVEPLNAIAFVEEQFGADPFAAVFDSGANANNGLAKRGKWRIQYDTDYADVGKDGGTISLELGGASSTLEIPKDAVCKDEDKDCLVRITARALLFKTPYGPVVLYDFGPDDLVFAKACKLKLITRFAKNTVLRLYWFNPETGRWEVEQRGEVDKKGVVEFEVHHFSKYAIS